ncbi:DUF5630 domain-containing protein [Legionella sp. 16cNR16C]|uniref:DUF5630 domain-containing protein n=1 Tax=Legionella sp. 16cNR16C TaxID=2905656 RepID=UPI001E5E73CB|nr:DUF5630 domain-containing protein [Legionella sp. 16cNR16C]MCE3043380.1 DUF5630 domain-containing protein [Legionella sp. 16cNR16C]
MPIDKKRILKQLNLPEVPVNEIISELSNCTFYELSLFYVNDRTPRAVLDGRAFESLWQLHREKLSLWDIPEFKLQKQTDFSDRELVLGLGLYYSAVSLKAQNQEKAFLKYLNLAMSYGSCQAFQTAVNDLEIEAHQVSRSEVQNTTVKLSEILKTWSSMLMKHRTPGLLLLANTNLFLARELKGACNSDMIIAAYQLTWQYLRMAELCEEDSQAAINNVYFGKGLALSNPFNLSDISTMKNELGVEVKALLTPSQVTYAENEALNLYNKQLKIVRLKAPPFSLGGSSDHAKALKESLQNQISSPRRG